MGTQEIENCILRAVSKVSPDQWVPFASMSDLRNRLGEIDKSAAVLSLGILWEAIACLICEGQLLAQKYVGGTATPFDPQRGNDETYQVAFFNQGQFKLKLTHEGRRCLDAVATESAGAQIESPAHLEFDDKIPQLYRAKHFLPDLSLLWQMRVVKMSRSQCLWWTLIGSRASTTLTAI